MQADTRDCFISSEKQHINTFSKKFAIYLISESHRLIIVDRKW